MKRETALRHAHTIAARLRSVSGLIGTPACRHEALRVSRAWIFGSTVKGSATPNDLDVLLECMEVGRHFRAGHGAKVDKRRLRRYGIRAAVSTTDEAYRFLSRGMKMVSLHDIECDGELAHPRVMIYPRNDL